MSDCYSCESQHGVFGVGRNLFFFLPLHVETLPVPLELLLVVHPLYTFVYVLFPPIPFFPPPLPRPYTSSFSRLFSSSGGQAKKPAVEAPVNVKYNAPTSQVQPTVKKKSSALQQLPSDKSKAFDFLNEE